MSNVTILDVNGKTVMADGAAIQAQFKQATVTGGTAKLQFEILTDNPEAFRIIRKSGKTVLIMVCEQQQELPFDEETGEVYD